MNQTPSMLWQPDAVETVILHALGCDESVYKIVRRFATDEKSDGRLVFSRPVDFLTAHLRAHRTTIKRRLDTLVIAGMLTQLTQGSARRPAQYQIGEVRSSPLCQEWLAEVEAQVRADYSTHSEQIESTRFEQIDGRESTRFEQIPGDISTHSEQIESTRFEQIPEIESTQNDQIPADLSTRFDQISPPFNAPPGPPINAVPDGAEPPSLAGARPRVPARSSKRLKELELGEILDQVQKNGQPNFNGTEAKPTAEQKPFAGQPGVTSEADATGVPSQTPSRFNVSITLDGDEIIAEGPAVDERATWEGPTGEPNVLKCAEALITETLAETDAARLEARHNAPTGQLAFHQPLGQLWGERIRSLGRSLGRPMMPEFTNHPDSAVEGHSAYWKTLTLTGLRGGAGSRSWSNKLTGLVHDRRYAAIFPQAAGTADLLALDKSLLILAAEYVAFLDQDAYESGDDKSFRESDYAAKNRRQLTDAHHAVTFLRPKQGKPDELIKVKKFQTYLDARALDPFYAVSQAALAREVNYVQPEFPVTAETGLYIIACPAKQGGRVIGTKFRVAEVGSTHYERQDGRIRVRVFDREYVRKSALVMNLTPAEWEEVKPELIPENSEVMVLLDTPGLTAEDYQRGINRICPVQLHQEEPHHD